MVNKVPKQCLKMNKFLFGCCLSQWQMSCDLLPAALLRCLLMLACIKDCQIPLFIYLTASCINQISFTQNVLSINVWCLPNFVVSHWAAKLPDPGEPLEAYSMLIHCCRQKIGVHRCINHRCHCSLGQRKRLASYLSYAVASDLQFTRVYNDVLELQIMS